MTRVLDTIEAVIQNKVAPHPRFAYVDAKGDFAEMNMEPNQYRIRFTITLWVEQTGPREAIPDMLRRARMPLAREIYGEIEEELSILKQMLLEETYRPPTDPVTQKLDGILKSIREWSD